jgi:hypothetical protein
MAEKKIKLADLLKGSGMEEIPKKWFTPEDGQTEKGGRRPADLVLPAGKEIVLQADAEDTRGLVVKWTDGKGYELYYWYEDPSKAVPSELIADGTSKGKSVKKVVLKYHAKPEDEK